MRELTAGMRYLGRGQRWVLGHGRWFGFGLLPALVALVLYGAALTALGFFADDIAAWATPFADGWDETWRDGLRLVFAVLLWLGGLLLSVVTFTAVTLLVGDPFYEKLSEQVEKSEGGCPDGPDRPLWRELLISLGASVRVLLRMLVFTVPLFFLGFLPVVGQTLIPALGFCVAGYFLTVELSSVAMQRRDIPVRERLRLLRARRSLALGFGVPLVLLFLVPLAAVFLMPGAVAGAALLVRDVTGEAPGADDDRTPGASREPEAYGTSGEPEAYGAHGAYGAAGQKASAPWPHGNAPQ